jgi:hypothetical protein
MMRRVILALALAGLAGASAAAPSRADEAYFQCYREVLGGADFAAMTPGQLDEARDRIASAVIDHCDRHLASRRREAEALVRRSSRAAGANGNDGFMRALTESLAGMALIASVGRDLDQAEPRMSVVADAHLRARAQEAVRLEEDNAAEAADARMIAGEGNANFINAEQVYSRCLTRSLVRDARADIVETLAFERALTACRAARAALIARVEQDRGSLVANIESSEGHMREEAPALVRAIRAATVRH